MGNFCGKCGTPLPVGSDADSCWRHGGPQLTTESKIRCPSCKEIIFADAKKCRFCGEAMIARDASPGQAATGNEFIAQARTSSLPQPVVPKSNSAGSQWMRRHPILALGVAFVGLLCISILGLDSVREPAATVQEVTTTIPNPPSTTPLAPPPKFRVYRAKTDEAVSYVVPVQTTDEELKSLLWFFRRKVRTGQFKELGITRPTSKQWGEDSYLSGSLIVYRGAKCASEEYISDQELNQGYLGPCGYGDHSDAGYQWGLSGDSQEDSADIRTKDGEFMVVFNYKDNWQPPRQGND